MVKIDGFYIFFREMVTMFLPSSVQMTKFSCLWQIIDLFFTPIFNNAQRGNRGNIKALQSSHRILGDREIWVTWRGASPKSPVPDLEESLNICYPTRILSLQ